MQDETCTVRKREDARVAVEERNSSSPSLDCLRAIGLSPANIPLYGLGGNLAAEGTISLAVTFGSLPNHNEIF